MINTRCPIGGITSFATVLLLSANLYAQQQPLTTMHFSGSGGGPGIGTGLNLFVEYFGRTDTTLFKNVVWTPAMVGQSILDTASSEPGYANFVSRLTDGVNQAIAGGAYVFPGGGGSSHGSLESKLLTTPPPGWNGIDLHGYPITGIRLTLNQISLDANADSNWTNYSWDDTLTIYTVPEPSTFAVAALGAAALLIAGRRR